ncbi:MAG TPA: MmcQ/YjbR family DNA-binding protein [Acidimicrobiales bacterium]|nr:MmcQ/YjbR family DNA-binding protein [Acidimicrobiales bacterium]
MATQDDVRRLALALPDAVEEDGKFAFAVPNRGKLKGFAWVWQERVEPKKPRVPNPEVLAVRVADAGEKEELLAAEPDVFFTEPHYNGFPAVLVRLAAIEVDELAELLTDAWRCQAPRALVRAFDARGPGPDDVT